MSKIGFKGRFIKQAKVAPAQFKRITDRQRDNIESVAIIPPKLGARDFGKLAVRFKVSVNDAELCLAR